MEKEEEPNDLQEIKEEDSVDDEIQMVEERLRNFKMNTNILDDIRLDLIDPFEGEEEMVKSEDQESEKFSKMLKTGSVGEVMQCLMDFDDEKLKTFNILQLQCIVFGMCELMKRIFHYQEREMNQNFIIYCIEQIKDFFKIIPVKDLDYPNAHMVIEVLMESICEVKLHLGIERSLQDIIRHKLAGSLADVVKSKKPFVIIKMLLQNLTKALQDPTAPDFKSYVSLVMKEGYSMLKELSGESAIPLSAIESIFVDLADTMNAFMLVKKSSSILRVLRMVRAFLKNAVLQLYKIEPGQFSNLALTFLVQKCPTIDPEILIILQQIGEKEKEKRPDKPLISHRSKSQSEDLKAKDSITSSGAFDMCIEFLSKKFGMKKEELAEKFKKIPKEDLDEYIQINSIALQYDHKMYLSN